MAYRQEECVDIEIIEPARPGDDRDFSGVKGLCAPREVRIDGKPVFIPAGESIKVHEILFNEEPRRRDLVQVTLTLFARSVKIGHEAQMVSASDGP